MMNKVNTAFTPPCYATLKRDIGMGYKASLNFITKFLLGRIMCQSTPSVDQRQKM